MNAGVKSLCLLCFVSLLFCACANTQGSLATAEYTELTKNTKPNVEQTIFLFFDGEPLNFTYKKLGLVDAIGEEDESDRDVLDKICYTAWLHNANAIITIKKQYRITEKTSSLDTHNKESYSAKSFQGIAVYISPDELKHIKASDHSDKGFVARANQNKQEKIWATTSLVVTSSLLAAAMLIYLSSLSL